MKRLFSLSRCFKLRNSSFSLSSHLYRSKTKKKLLYCSRVTPQHKEHYYSIPSLREPFERKQKSADRFVDGLERAFSSILRPGRFTRADGDCFARLHAPAVISTRVVLDTHLHAYTMAPIANFSVAPKVVAVRHGRFADYDIRRMMSDCRNSDTRKYHSRHRRSRLLNARPTTAARRRARALCRTARWRSVAP